MLAVKQIIEKGKFFLSVDKHGFLDNYSQDYYIEDSNNHEKVYFGSYQTLFTFLIEYIEEVHAGWPGLFDLWWYSLGLRRLCLGIGGIAFLLFFFCLRLFSGGLF
jgi:hypothetical protein